MNMNDSKKRKGKKKRATDPLDDEARQDFGWEIGGSGSSSEIPQAGINRIADLNEDVLNLIFKSFDLQPGSPTVGQTRKDLLSAAKVCKAFAEPALNSLWRVLPSLLPLLLLLPSAAIVSNEYFVDNLPFKKWERFELHSRRVRTLYMEPETVLISPMIYIRIRSIMCDIPLLLGLKAIYIPDHNPIDFHSIILLALETSLDSVELVNDNAISKRNFFLPFLTALSQKSPQLGYLALRGTRNISLEPVYHFTNLHRLEIRLPGTYLYPKTLQRLENMDNLVDLTLDVGASVPVHVIGDTQLLTSIPSSHRNSGTLKRLHIIGIPSSITRVLDNINLSSLNALVIDEISNNEGVETESFWRRCFDQISVCHGIEDIEINRPTSRVRPLPLSWCFPLLNLNEMKSLVINGAVLSGSDEDFRQLACGFPKLKKLVVPAQHDPWQRVARTLACLYHFSQCCPDLRKIKICLESDILKNLDTIKKLPHPISVHRLQKLYVNSNFGQIQTTHMIRVAQFLDLLFPNLSTLEAYDSDPTEASNWAEIQEIRVALQSARISALHSDVYD